jgi:Protein of unknown function (DUF1203)
MSFVIKALEGNIFSNLFEKNTSELNQIGALKMIVEEFPGYPCRVSLEDVPLGEEVILLPFEHHKVDSPYRSSGPIYIRKGAKTANLAVNEIPKMLNDRLLSLRGFNINGIMKDAIVIEGACTSESIKQLFENQEIAYLHIHNAKPGCYNCLVERA